MAHSRASYSKTLIVGCCLTACSGAGQSAGDGAPDAAVDGATPAPTISTFVFEGRQQAVCPGTTLWCLANWPPPKRGTVFQYRSTEHRGTRRHARRFFAYVPERATGQVPLWLMLHAGGGDALDALATTALVRMADRRGADPGIAWQRATKACTFREDDGFVDDASSPCEPEQVRFNNAQAFIAVFPEGIVDASDPSKRHWEDGRVPSPGAEGEAESRDDLGFLDHVIEVLLAEEAARVDPARLYLSGSENGGMMAHRVLCNAGNDARYPHLHKLAAVATHLAAMAEPLKEGDAGREHCPTKGSHQLGIASIVGRGVPTPDCEPFPCKSPTVSGDGLMPYGEPGGRHHVWSPAGGRVISVVDTHNHWRDYLVAATGSARPTGQRELAGFTELVTVSYGEHPARLLLITTEGGHHASGSSRMDTHLEARAWSFLSSFTRADGLSFEHSTALTGDY